MSDRDQTYDYIVVGGGSAGCAVSARLSEDPALRVLLLEAGPATGPAAMSVPARWQELLGSEIDWAYITVPQPGTDGVAHAWPRGKVLGGSSAINGMAFARGDRSGYDGWDAGGAKGWSYRDLLPYFKRSEHTDGRDPAYRGTSGPLTVTPMARRHPLSEAFFDAILAAGHPRTEDISGADQYGVGWYDANIVDGVRQTSADAYLRPHLDRPNLTVSSDAYVRGLIMTRDRCTGVSYELNGETRSARADGEVVLCAGTIGFPQLLLLSGIGPAPHLRELGIGVVADLRGVGENLHDHVQSGIVYATDEEIPPGVNNHTELTALLRSDPSVDHPDVQLYPIHAPYSPALTEMPEHGYTIAAALSTPHSRGTLRLASADPHRPPLIDPHYLDDVRDVDTLAAGLQMARQVGETSAFRRWKPTEVVPGPQMGDAAAERDFIRRSASTQVHPVGTCRIGADDLAVVGPDLRIHGVRGLRIADTSVMPSIPSMNPNATVMAIAERAAALITSQSGPGDIDR
jgi:choline dehydrogenase